MFGVLFFSLVVLLSCVLIAWYISLRTNDLTVIEPFWGLAFIAVTWVAFAYRPSSTRHWLLAILVTIWGLRLTTHVLLRRNGETGRYARLRKEFGDQVAYTSLYLFCAAAGAVWLIAMPIVITERLDPHRQHGFWFIDYLGVAVWGVGFLIETVADAHLFWWRRKPEGSNHVLDRGLWAWTRHPNYFGELLVWCGFYIICAASGWAALAIWSPVLVGYLLLRVTGVPPLERELLRSRPAYEHYLENVSEFWPKRPPPRPPDELEVDNEGMPIHQSKTVVAKVTMSNPAAAKPAVSNPAAARSNTSGTRPAVSQPSGARPAASHPSAARPLAQVLPPRPASPPKALVSIIPIPLDSSDSLDPNFDEPEPTIEIGIPAKKP